MPAKRTPTAETKASRRTLDDGTPVHSFHMLATELSTIVRNTFRTPDAGADAPTFDLTTVATAQQRALDFARQFTM
ncbi:MAG: hypothetical protein U5S82_14020 [Gammaproteobacteria bacterium]|nr:hypothetical protein [Gammaproteobacteria bacterium]